MVQFLNGALMMSCLVVCIFFYTFWKKSQDRLFLIFSGSFFLLALERMFLGVRGLALEPRPFIYFIRLLAFTFILVAIIDKNRKAVSD